VALTAALGAALITGVAGGSFAAAATHAAAAATHHAATDPPAAAHHAPTDPPAAESAATVSGLGLAPSTDAGSELDDAPWHPPALPLGEAADGVQQKVRPQPPRVTTAAAVWVDPNPTAQVTSCFGMRWGRMHEGVDLAAPDGTPIVAAGAGPAWPRDTATRC